MLKLEYIKKIRDDIKNYAHNGELCKAEKLIEKFKSDILLDIEIITIKSAIEFEKGNLDEAENILIDVYRKYEFNFDINYNLAIINISKNNTRMAFRYFLKAIIADKTQEEMVLKEINGLLRKCKKYDEFEEEKNKVNECSKIFPLVSLDEAINYIGKEIKTETENFYCGIYDNYLAVKDGIFLENINGGRTLFKTEILKSKKTKNEKICLKSNYILPIMKLKNNKVKLQINDQIYSLENNIINRYYYYNIKSGDKVLVKSNEDFVLGNVIELNNDKTKPKLVLNIFIDGLSQEILKDDGIKEYMPNTYKFFKKGTICNNVYVAGEWTYVSLANIFTGMYTTNHRVYHPNFETKNLFLYKLYTEVLNENKYFCSKIDGNWRCTPSLGYVKGIDRGIYQSNIRGMYSKDIISEIIENLETFKEKNNFLWTCFFDLHDVSDELEMDTSCQAKCSLESRFDKSTKESSVRKEYTEHKVEKYKLQLKRMDVYLGILFNYIMENYSENEYLITLFSDHGQGYLVKEDEFLGDQRSNIPLMFRGRNIPNGECNEIISSLDIFPIILESIGIKRYDINDGNLPQYFGGKNERKYTITESIFPGSPYRIAINDTKHVLFLETEGMCTDDGRIPVENLKVKLINKYNKKDEKELYLDKVEEYMDIVINHIKDYIII